MQFSAVIPNETVLYREIDNYVQRCCDKHWNYKMKVTQSTLKNDMP